MEKSNLSRPQRNSRFTPGYESTSVDPAAAARVGHMSTSQIEGFKRLFMSEFPRAARTIEAYSAVDQGDQDACSLVGLINCAQLAGLPPEDVSAAKRGWKREWSRRGGAVLRDIGDMLDEFEDFLDRCGLGCREYIPINGVEEQYYDKTRWDPLESQRRFNVSSSEYDKSPFVFENGRLVETLLDSSTPVEINALEHSRTAIAYNEEHVLFADNWTASVHSESSQRADRTGRIVSRGQLVPDSSSHSSPIELYAAGFSRVNKWVVYSMMRDVAYFPRAGGRGGATGAASSRRGRARTPARSTASAHRGDASVEELTSLGLVKYRDLQRLAKKIGVRANGTAESLRARICADRRRRSAHGNNGGIVPNDLFAAEARAHLSNRVSE